MAGENVFVHVKGDITWIGVYTKSMNLVEPSETFWDDPKQIPIEELPPQLDSETVEDVSSGKHLKKVVEQLHDPDGEQRLHLFRLSCCHSIN